MKIKNFHNKSYNKLRYNLMFICLIWVAAGIILLSDYYECREDYWRSSECGYHGYVFPFVIAFAIVFTSIFCWQLFDKYCNKCGCCWGMRQLRSYVDETWTSTKNYSRNHGTIDQPRHVSYIDYKTHKKIVRILECKFCRNEVRRYNVTTDVDTKQQNGGY